MNIASRAFLAVMLAVSLPIAFLQYAHEADDQPTPVMMTVSDGWPDFSVILAVRDSVALDAAGGRRSLFEAATLFGELNKIPPQVMPPAHDDPGGPSFHMPLNTTEARLCRQVVIFAYWSLRQKGREPDAEAAAARLTEEFREELRRSGAIRLPEPATLEPVVELLAKARRDRLTP